MSKDAAIIARNKRNASISDYRFAKKRLKMSDNQDYLCDQYLDGVSWADFGFLGRYKGRKVYYNATIETVANAYHEHISSIANEMAYEKYPFEKGELRIVTEPIGNGLHRMIPHESEVKKSRATFYKSKELELYGDASNGHVTQKSELDFEYRYGIGLHVIINEAHISNDVIIDFIENFNRNPDYLDTESKYVLTKEEREKYACTLAVPIKL